MSTLGLSEKTKAKTEPFENVLLASSVFPVEVKSCLARAGKGIDRVHKAFLSEEQADIMLFSVNLKKIEMLLVKAIDLAMLHQKDRLSVALNTYKDQMNYSQQPIIADENLSIADKFNLLINSAGQLAREKEAVHKAKQHIKVFLDTLENTKEAVRRCFEEANQLVTDILHAPVQIQKLPNMKQCVTQIMCAYQSVARGIEQTIGAMYG